MHEDAAAFRLTADDFLAAAAQFDLRASRRLITDWVSLGLLDQPDHPGRGRAVGGSNKGTWPPIQGSLFLDLLALRQNPVNPVTSVAWLANLPVCGWLWGGDEYGVPLRQVRRALATWCGHHRTRESVSGVRARKIAREMLKQFDNPHASRADRQALLEFLVTSIRTQTFDAEKASVAVERVFDPHQVGRSVGPMEVAATAAGIARMLKAQATGFLVLKTFTDQEFEDARVIYRQSRRDLVQLLSRFTPDWQGSPLKQDDATYESVLNGACANLLFPLGFGRLSPRRSEELAAEARTAEERQTAT